MRKILTCLLAVFPLYVSAQTAADCMGAVSICDTVFVLSSLPVEVNEFPNEINPNISCLTTGESRGRWYKFAAINSGTLSFTILPADTTYDFDWALFRMTGTPCSQIYGDTSLAVRCDFSGINGTNGSTGADGLPGLGHRPVVNVSVPSVYYLFVSSAAMDTSQHAGYSIDFSASTITLEDCGEIGVEETELPGNFQVFPNPATDKIAVSLLCEKCETATFTLFAPNGQLLFSRVISAGSTEYISLDDLPAGMYFYRVMEKNGKINGEKLIIY